MELGIVRVRGASITTILDEFSDFGTEQELILNILILTGDCTSSTYLSICLVSTEYTEYSLVSIYSILHTPIV